MNQRRVKKEVVHTGHEEEKEGQVRNHQVNGSSDQVKSKPLKVQLRVGVLPFLQGPYRDSGLNDLRERCTLRTRVRRDPEKDRTESDVFVLTGRNRSRSDPRRRSVTDGRTGYVRMDVKGKVSGRGRVSDRV